jgi:hypothetical protein
MMGYLLYDMTHQAFRGATPEEKAIGRKQLATMFAMQIAMAGALSLPGIEIAKLGFVAAAALGFGDGWEEEEEKLRQFADETFGKTAGELLTRGVLSRALNVDLSQRLSQADFLTHGEPRKYDAGGVLEWGAQQVGGAPLGAGLDALKGLQKAGEGEWGEALEKLLPIKIFGDALKAANKYSEGKATPVEVAMNTFGVRSGRQAEESRRTGASIRHNTSLDNTHRELGQKYLKADTAAERLKIRLEIIKFNKTAPLRYRVFPSSLDHIRQRVDQERVS